MMSKSSTTTEVDTSFRRLPPLHVGEVLREEFFAPLNLSPYLNLSLYNVAKALGVPRTRIERLVREETALRLSRYFGTAAEYWMNLQSGYELESAKRTLASKLAKIAPRSPSASPRSSSNHRARAA